MTGTFLAISSKNYSSWSLRGWLLCRMAGLDFAEEIVAPDDPSNRAELLLLSPSILVPCVTHKGVRIWDTLAIAGVPQRSQSESGAAAGGTRRPRPLPLERRRNAFGVHQSAIGAADEPQSPSPRFQNMVRSAGGHRAHRNDLARVLRGSPRPVSVREIDDGRRDVRACRNTLPDLRREARPPMRRLLRADHGPARHGRMALGRDARTGGARRTRDGVLSLSGIRR